MALPLDRVSVDAPDPMGARLEIDPSDARGRRLALTAVPWRIGASQRLSVLARATVQLVASGAGTLLEAEPFLGKPGELAPVLPHAQLTLVGHAYAPRGTTRGMVATRVALQRGGQVLLDKSVLVYGDRATPGDLPREFSAMPLVYERAPAGPWNPSGRSLARGDAPPNLVPASPTHPIACFAPVPATWSSRSSLLAAGGGVAIGTPEARFGLFDFRYFQDAPYDQWLAPLRGDETLTLEGLSPHVGSTSTSLPGLTLRAAWWHRSGVGGATPLRLDAIDVDVDRGVASLVWRGHFGLPAGASAEDVLVRVALGATPPSLASIAAIVDLPPQQDVPAAEDTTARMMALDPTWLGESELDTTMAVDVDELARSVATPFSPARSPSPPTAPRPRETLAELRASTVSAAQPAVALDQTLPVGAILRPRPPSSSGWPAVGVSGEPASTPRPAPSSPGTPAVVGPPSAAAPSSVPSPPPVRASSPAMPAVVPSSPPPGLSLPALVPSGAAGPPAPRGSSPALPAVSSSASPPAAVVATRPSEELGDTKGPATMLAGLSDEAVRSRDLTGAQLRGVDLAGRDLRGSKLARADLSGAKLRQCRLDEADLAGANLAGADLEGTSLQGAHLRGANLSRAILRAAQLARADLNGANLTHALLDGANLERADLTGADASDASLERAILRRATVKATRFSRAKLRGANLESADGEEVHLDGADLSHSRAERARLPRAEATRARLDDAEWSHAQLEGANLTGAFLMRTKASHANFAKVNLSGADLTEACLRASSFRGATAEGTTFEAADLRGADLVGAVFDEVALGKARTTNAKRG